MAELKKVIVVKKTHSVKTGLDYISAFLKIGSYDKMLNIDKYGIMLLTNMSPSELENKEVGWVSKEFVINDN